MKNNIKIGLYILSTSLFLISCVDESYKTPVDDVCVSPNLTKNKEVVDVYAAALTTGATKIYSSDDIIEGYVVSSDEGGNFFQSMFVQPTDGTKGFNISVGEGNLYTKGFQPGKKIYLKMKGLGFANPTSGNRGLVFGAPPTSTFAVDRISELTYKNFMIPSCDVISEDLIVSKITLAQVSDTYLNKLVEFDNVEFTSDFVGGSFDTNRNDEFDSNTLITNYSSIPLPIRTSRFSSFGGNVVPKENGKIRGVLTKFGSGFQLILRTLRDLNLTNKRVGPINLIKEPFSVNGIPSTWSTFSVLGAQVWELGVFGTNYYAQMNGFSGGSNVNEDWLITPRLDLVGYSAATVSFDTAKANFAGNPIQAYVSTTYSGTGSPNAPGVVWTELTGFPIATNFTVVNSGNLSLTPYIGKNAYVGFKYTSTISASTTWQLDNIKVQATY